MGRLSMRKKVPTPKERDLVSKVTPYLYGTVCITSPSRSVVALITIRCLQVEYATLVVLSQSSYRLVPRCGLLDGYSGVKYHQFI